MRGRVVAGLDTMPEYYRRPIKDIAIQLVRNAMVHGIETPEERRAAQKSATGQLTVDIYEAPIVAQSWFVLDRIRAIARDHGAGMEQAIKLVQYFRDLRHYPFYNRVRGLPFRAGELQGVIQDVISNA